MEFLDILSAIGGVCIPIAIGSTVAWRGARREARLLKELLDRYTPGPLDRGRRDSAVEDARDAMPIGRTGPVERIDRMERAVESIALELERLAEGQRFVARVLTERAGPEALAPAREAPRSVTPH